MTYWLLAALALYLAHVYVTALIYFPQVGFSRHVRGRDGLPEPSILAGRAQRGLGNLKENMPIFLTLGVLALVVENADMAQAVLGAKVFLVARLAYLPLYLMAIPLTRSISYSVGLVGLGVMALALI